MFEVVGGPTKQHNAMIYLGIEPQRSPQHHGNEVPSYSSRAVLGPNYSPTSRVLARPGCSSEARRGLQLHAAVLSFYNQALQLQDWVSVEL